MQHTFGYARVCVTDQNLDTPLDNLTQAGYTRIFPKKVSGTHIKSLAFGELFVAIHEGDVAIVNRLAWLGHNMVHVIQLVAESNC